MGSHHPTHPALPDLNTLPLSALHDALATSGLVRRLLQLAHDEDLGHGYDEGDITTIACPIAATTAEAMLTAREACVVSGLAAMPVLIELFAPAVRYTPARNDGERVNAGHDIAHLIGPPAELLRLERTMLNLLSRLSGVATLTAQYVEAVRARAPGSPAQVLDTRKTTPGLRVLEKYAVRCGGGFVHRIGLHDAVLIKDNHLAHVPLNELNEFVATASRRARELRSVRFVEVEVDSLEQLDVLLQLPRGTIDFVLLDNMPPDILRDAVARRNRSASRPLLEASGGITLDTIAEVARTGVDRISTGALTRHARSVDLALDFA